MGVTHVLDIGDQPVCELDVAQISIVFFGNSRPGSKVNFINTDGLLRPVSGFPFFDPRIVTPFEAIKIEDQGRRLDSVLAEERAGIAFQDDVAEAVPDFVFVMSALTNPWDENFP